MRRFLVAAVPVLLIASAVPDASAAPYTFSSSGTFSDCSGCSIANSNAKIGWGGGNSVNSPNYNGSFITANPLTGQTGATPATHDQIGSLTWFNESTEAGSTASVVNADYKLTISFTAPLPGAVGSTTFDLKITNTVNSFFVCGSFFGCSDTGTLTGNPSSVAIDGLILSNFAFDETGDGTYDQTSHVWSNPENGTSTLRIYADIAQAPVAVPEPASLALLGAGLLGVGWVRSRRAS